VLFNNCLKQSVAADDELHILLRQKRLGEDLAELEYTHTIATHQHVFVGANFIALTLWIIIMQWHMYVPTYIYFWHAGQN
jgi:hypothetical protein